MSWSLHCKTIYRGEGWQFRTILTSTTSICCLVDRLVHNTFRACQFKYWLYQTHFGYTKEHIKFRLINAYRAKLDKHFPLYFSYLDIKFVPHFQDIIHFSPLLLLLCLFSTFSNFQLCMCLQRCTVACYSSLSHCLFNIFFSFLFIFLEHPQ